MEILGLILAIFLISVYIIKCNEVDNLKRVIRRKNEKLLKKELKIRKIHAIYLDILRDLTK